MSTRPRLNRPEPAVSRSHVIMVRPDQILPNPFRNPNLRLDDRKVDEITRSIMKSGVWPSIHVRPAPNARDGSKLYEAAFGHHRLEAIRRLAFDADYKDSVERIEVVVQDHLTDEDMIIKLANENSQWYGTDFLPMWDAWVKAFAYVEKNSEVSEKRLNAKTAKMLGWVDKDGKATRTANVCMKLYEQVEQSTAASKEFPDDIEDDFDPYVEFEGYSTNAVYEELSEHKRQLDYAIKKAKHKLAAASERDTQQNNDHTHIDESENVVSLDSARKKHKPKKDDVEVTKDVHEEREKMMPIWLDSFVEHCKRAEREVRGARYNWCITPMSDFTTNMEQILGKLDTFDIVLRSREKDAAKRLVAELRIARNVIDRFINLLGQSGKISVDEASDEEPA